MMDLGDGDRDPVALPGLPQSRCEPGIVLETLHPHGLGIGIAVAAVAAVEMLRIEMHPVVEESLAGEIMVDPQDVGPGLAGRETVEGRAGHSRAAKASEERMTLVDPAATQDVV